MVSLKKSLMIICIILYINVNSSCSAVIRDEAEDSKSEYQNPNKPIPEYQNEFWKIETSAEMKNPNKPKPEYQSILEAMELSHIKEDMQEYKRQCIIGIKSFCTGNGKTCNNISDYAGVIAEFIAFEDIKIPQAKSFVYFVWKEVVRNREKKIKTPGKYCKDVGKDESVINEADCLEILKTYKFVKRSTFSSNIDTLESVFFLWSNFRTDLILVDEEKQIVSGYVRHHLDKLTIKPDSSALKQINIPEHYCEKIMCKYELDTDFNNGVNPIKMFKKILTYTSIHHAFREIIFRDLKFAVSKYFFVYLFKILVFPEKVIEENLIPYCDKQLRPSDEMKWASLNGPIDEIVKRTYFEWSRPIVNRNKEILPSEGIYLEDFNDLLSNKCLISDSNHSEHVGYNPQSFCKKTGLLPSS